MEKNFIIRCPKCRWAEMSTGISADLVHLQEIPNNCEKCGKPRRFKCPKCGQHAIMNRVKVNSYDNKTKTS